MNTALSWMVEGTTVQELQNHGQMSLAASIALFGYDGKDSTMEPIPLPASCGKLGFLKAGSNEIMPTQADQKAYLEEKARNCEVH